MSVVHIYAPPSEAFALVTHCPTCVRLRRMYGRHYEWHGTTIVCAGCGDSWQDGEMSERPFSPGWRRQSIEYARAGLAELGVPA